MVRADKRRDEVGRIEHRPLSTTDRHLHDVVGDWDAAFTIGLRVPRCTHIYWPAEPESGGEATLWLVDPESQSWSSLHHFLYAETDPGEYTVRQHGPRRLWDEVDAAYRWWRDVGNPAAGRWVFTVTPEGQRVELVTEACHRREVRDHPADRGGGRVSCSPTVNPHRARSGS